MLSFSLQPEIPHLILMVADLVLLHYLLQITLVVGDFAGGE